MKVSISEAARIAGVSRQHFYVKYVNPGVISVDRENRDKPMIDTSELLRVFGNIQLPDSVVSENGHDITRELSSKILALDSEVTALRQQLAASQEREQWLQGTVDKLADTIRLLEHRTETAVPRRGFWSRLLGGAV